MSLCFSGVSVWVCGGEGGVFHHHLCCRLFRFSRWVLDVFFLLVGVTEGGVPEARLGCP